MDNTNLKVIRESFGRVVYTHKTYEKIANQYFKQTKIVKWANVILLTFTSGSVLGAAFEDSGTLAVTGSILSTLALFFVIFQLSFSPEKLAQKYKNTANQLWLIREKYINLMADIINEKLTPEEIIKQRNRLIDELRLIYNSAQATTKKAYKEASKALKISEEMTFSDEEINKFLPDSLHV